MRKRGFLLAEETLKIIIAVIAIAFLIYFLTALYFAKVNGEKLKQAEFTLKNSSSGSIATVIDRVRQGIGNQGGNAESLIIKNPSGWHLFGFTGGDIKPNSCLNENCLCICGAVYIDTFFGLVDSRQIKECDEDGACLVVSDLKNTPLDMKIEPSANPTTLLIQEINNFIEVS